MSINLLTNFIPEVRTKAENAVASGGHIGTEMGLKTAQKLIMWAYLKGQQYIDEALHQIHEECEYRKPPEIRTEICHRAEISYDMFGNNS